MEIGRNEPCPCGSGRKYKKCCLGQLDFGPRLLGAPATEPMRSRLLAIEARIEKGYDVQLRGDSARAARLWLEIWEEILALLPPEVERLEQVEILSGLQDLEGWSADAELDIHNTALDDPALARRGIDLYERVLARFPRTPSVPALERELVELWCAAGERQRGEELLVARIEADPDEPDAYVHLAQLLSCERYRPTDADRERAVRLLETALARPVHDADDWGIAELLAELRPTHPG